MKPFPVLPAILFACLVLLPNCVLAGSATWNPTPTSADWNTASNWIPNTVPNSAIDIATFGVSDITDISTSAGTGTEVDSIVFEPGASAYTITVADPWLTLTFSGTGIVNNSGIAQDFVNLGFYSNLDFTDEATAGSNTFFVGSCRFDDDAGAGMGTFTAPAGAVDGASGAVIVFFDSSTAGDATVLLDGSPFTNPNTSGAVDFGLHANAGNATIVANAGINGGAGGRIYFINDSQGGTARLKAFDNALIDIGLHGSSPCRVGSIEGDGTVDLGDKSLWVGSNGLSTTFSGLITGNIPSKLAKIGRGTLTLTGANTYAGKTLVNGGILVVNNRGGSGTGTGPVTVRNGTLAGDGTITGPVDVGSGSGPGANLGPGARGTVPGTLTILSRLTFEPDSTLFVLFDTDIPAADQVVAKGTVIHGGQIQFGDNGTSALTPGTVFTVISNTSAIPISGTFANLPDGGTVTVGSNTYKANYEGGTGNDLTLTVQ